MNRAGRIIAVCGLSMALMMPQAAYAAETLSVQVSAREGITTVGNKQSAYDNVAISHVSNYVNIRSEANTSSSIVGKIYNNCAATILATVDGEGGTWYQIQSGSVKGYIKSEYFITGAEAEKIAKNVGTVYVTVSADGLNLREQPNMNSAPCGVCRQVMAEFCDPETFRIILMNGAGEIREYLLKELLPLGFTGKALEI